MHSTLISLHEIMTKEMYSFVTWSFCPIGSITAVCSLSQSMTCILNMSKPSLSEIVTWLLWNSRHILPLSQHCQCSVKDNLVPGTEMPADAGMTSLGWPADDKVFCGGRSKSCMDAGNRGHPCHEVQPEGEQCSGNGHMKETWATLEKGEQQLLHFSSVIPRKDPST